MKGLARNVVLVCLTFAASAVNSPAFPQNNSLVTNAQAENSSSSKADKSANATAGLSTKRLSFVAMLPLLPRRVTSKAGAPGDMVNLLIVGSQEQVAGAFKAAGWFEPDKTPEDALVHAIQETMAHKAYAEMPMSTLYLFGRPQDYSFVDGMPIQIVTERNHFRVWRAPWLDSDGHTVWAGAGTHDVGIEKDAAGELTHRIDPNVDTERGYIVQTLEGAGKVAKTEYLMPADPIRDAVTATGDAYHSDGRILVIYLK